MSLRPRYSLLTLLVLTALVAGGVKLWRGPHHVVERWAPQAEEEYTYTRDWRGNKIKHGIYVERHYKTDETTLHSVGIKCYRYGEQLPWCYELTKYDEKMNEAKSLSLLDKTDLSSAERLDCEQTIHREKKRFAAQGSQVMGVFFSIEYEAGIEVRSIPHELKQ